MQETIKLKSINPKDGSFLQQFTPLTPDKVEEIIAAVSEEQKSWKQIRLSKRINMMRELAKTIRNDKERIAKTISMEMGKVITEAYAEVDKCVWVCEYYADHSEELLKPQMVETDAFKSYIRFDPIGTVLLIMPWNFPFWQVFRAAIPAIMMGNTILLKHASNVQGCATMIDWHFDRAGFPKNTFRNLCLPASDIAPIIKDPRVRGVSFTGSEAAGKKVAALCGEAMKKCVMELGGSDPFIVLEDADMELVCQEAIRGRLSNVGQVCISSKRFIIHKKHYDTFIAKMKTAFEAIQPDYDPFDTEATYGPMARENIMNELDQQVKKTVEEGGKLIYGGERFDEEGYYYKPTLIADVTPEMTAFKEETFGPLMPVILAESDQHAIELANNSRFGLSATLWTKDMKKGEKLAKEIESGMVFINGLSRSDPRLPFGGVKDSGFGREVSQFGLLEFANIKTVWVN